MVFDKIEHAPLYYGLGPRFQMALEWLSHVDPASLIPGQRVDIDGDNVYATLFDVDTLPPEECKLECHRDYADVQYLVQGEEAAGYLLDGPAQPLSEYTPDIQFFSGKWDALTVRAGTFYIVWPQDLHAPRMATNAPARVVRLVAKVKL